MCWETRKHGFEWEAMEATPFSTPAWVKGKAIRATHTLRDRISDSHWNLS
ncbi:MULTISPECIES: hypothetical protein [unclassified Limnospira]|nr:MULTISPECIES: hypothetical protein [unclassified Limnospira]MDT9190598.1 hypothetical protein [Limnospira sp. PMC 894.15]MDT9236576.1 hypothetical protein [Limnospira sp. PMC 917.15]MDT9318336.1 hypothetical protein [Limnospira sp. PMC 1306.21]MDT9180426.1 hypothetical protein [Limnospira sp. PMC 1238.20]MDT9195966.1 hypothetical protein [Limnospira sp. PMC 1245.20]